MTLRSGMPFFFFVLVCWPELADGLVGCRLLAVAGGGTMGAAGGLVSGLSRQSTCTSSKSTMVKRTMKIRNPGFLEYLFRLSVSAAF
ncbi:hypothetical protein BDY21DRAFT_345015 [Lineolata rhizophorae]|uniref:Secreted protein n=1 Tax=Lineolata rhizophorae TaxID=578093 RepID=A0A6A6NZX7_9PEZI|nr:hypothetical protein BDY21DRAFT_345015 [Lineolata rhizophorae]